MTRNRAQRLEQLVVKIINSELQKVSGAEYSGSLDIDHPVVWRTLKRVVGLTDEPDILIQEKSKATFKIGLKKGDKVTFKNFGDEIVQMRVASHKDEVITFEPLED